ncbi:hypothetical protein GIB67_011733 [Kingdonia uniflora]|uniref:Uncharacterized protein n=1 Tax=Kingdonia uniflora TaxID=39325 RepID=A0A7J7LU99_9MAGN|nr:hypothetical protein GIB67_011733 [Kingdonia uniflora]
MWSTLYNRTHHSRSNPEGGVWGPDGVVGASVATNHDDHGAASVSTLSHGYSSSNIAYEASTAGLTLNRSNAEEALQGLNEMTLGKNTVSLSWGHSSVNNQDQITITNGMVEAHTIGQAYDGSYGYATPVSQDPNMYAAAAAATAYGAYPTYGNNQQQEREYHIRVHGYVLKQRTTLGVILSVLLAAAIEYSSIKEIFVTAYSLFYAFSMQIMFTKKKPVVGS